MSKYIQEPFANLLKCGGKNEHRCVTAAIESVFLQISHALGHDDAKSVSMIKLIGNAHRICPNANERMTAQRIWQEQIDLLLSGWPALPISQHSALIG